MKNSYYILSVIKNEVLIMKMSMKQICKELKKTAQKTMKPAVPMVKKPVCGRHNDYVSATPDLRSTFYKVNRDRGNNSALIAGAVKYFA